MFTVPFENHYNDLHWRESNAEFVVIRADSDGHIELGPGHNSGVI